MQNKKKKFKYSLNCDCNHNYLIAKTYRSRPKKETNFKIKGKYLRRYYKCNFCEHHVSDHNYDLSSIYSKYYIKFTYGNYDDLKKKFKKINNLNPIKSDNHYRCLRINSFFNRINKKIKTLDVGAGLGVFPNKLKSNKFRDFYLIETDKINIKFLKEYLKFKKTFKTRSSLKNIKFDLITLNKVVEHVPNPTLFIKNYLKCLKKKGFIYIEVPNIDAKEDPLGYDREEFYIEHHHVFSKLSLTLMLSKLNLNILQIKKIREPSSKYTLFCFAQKIK